MPDLSVSVTINKPIDLVWEHVSNPRMHLEWMGVAREREFAARPVVEKGTITRHVDKVLGVRLASTWEIIECDPPYKLAARSISSPFGATFEWELSEPTEGETELKFRAEGEPGLGGLFGKIADEIVTRSIRRQLTADFENLKDLLETDSLGKHEH